jgi:hypothetical protein
MIDIWILQKRNSDSPKEVCTYLLYVLWRNITRFSIQTAYKDIFGKLVPVVLRLAVDSEAVAVQLFAPLGIQLVRLFSGHDSMPETELLLEKVSEVRLITRFDKNGLEYFALCRHWCLTILVCEDTRHSALLTS